MTRHAWLFASTLLLCRCALAQAPAPDATEPTVRLALKPEMLRSESAEADFSGLVDEQDALGDPPKSAPKTSWQARNFPATMVLDLGAEKHLSALWFYDTNNAGDIAISTGSPAAWKPVAQAKTDSYLSWKTVPLSATTRFVRIELLSGGAIFNEIALYAYTDAGFEALQARLAKEKREAEASAAALVKARAEVSKRPVVTIAPFGRLSLVDEVEVGAATPGHNFSESPAGVSRVQSILGKPCRVLPPTEGEAAYMSFRLGRFKLLKPGAAYVLDVEYPEDDSRSWIVQNGGSETSRGFFTGRATGDAFHPKYVNNLNESINVPLSGKYQSWRLLFSLHDRFPTRDFSRGAGPRILQPADGFPVTIAQFSASNIPASQGAAVSRIRLYEVLEPQNLKASYTLPTGLPQRHLFWREEMADGVIESDKEEERGVRERLDWYRYKARLARFLGMDTYSKDLLEFGAVQHWDTSPLGGNDWAFFKGSTKDLWGQIVQMMGEQGLNVLPYYEYAGSKGYKGLGNERRAKPLSRDDAYTHIDWVESSNADITDPDTFEDFRKMLDLTIVRQKSKARFIGLWLRPRMQLPMGFGDSTRERFSREANAGKPVTRDELKADKALLSRYESWWMGKRREFLVAMRKYLADSGIESPLVLYTGESGESGTGFASYEPRMVTDDPSFWAPIVARPEHLNGADKTKTSLLTPQDVAKQNLYLEALQHGPLTWGGWEWQYANPGADPADYKQTPGVLLTHAFNRNYTVASPATFDAFRAPSGLALIRHYSLNENMMFDRADKEKLGYFVADIERAGPYCMMAEALAMANGDPTEIGYLSGSSFGRGFPEYARAFNTAFLSLPALPSRIVAGAASDSEIVVREIATPNQGTFYALVNTGMKAKSNVSIKLPGSGAILNAATGQAVGGASTFYPFELKAWKRK